MLTNQNPVFMSLGRLFRSLVALTEREDCPSLGSERDCEHHSDEVAPVQELPQRSHARTLEKPDRDLDNEVPSLHQTLSCCFTET